MSEPSAAAVRELVDKQALYELVVRYCRAIDRRDFALLRSLYCDDAVDDHGAMFCGAADDYVRWVETALQSMAVTVHSLSNALFAVDGDRAEGEVHATSYHRTVGPDAWEFVIGGRYLDHYRRQGGVWRFHRRAIVTDWATARPFDAPGHREFASMTPEGRADGTDPSYTLLSRFPPAGQG